MARNQIESQPSPCAESLAPNASSLTCNILVIGLDGFLVYLIMAFSVTGAFNGSALINPINFHGASQPPGLPAFFAQPHKTQYTQ